VDGQATGTGFVIPFVYGSYPGESVEIRGFTVTGAGSAAAAILGAVSGSIAIRHCKVTHNTALAAGSAITANICDLVLEDSDVSFNVATVTAGVYAVSGDVEIRRCRFEGNQGRAVDFRGLSNQDVVIIQDSEFATNRMAGAAVVVVDPLSVQIERNWFVANANLVNTGAGLDVALARNSVVRFNTFAYDTSNYGGSGLYLSEFAGEVSYNTFVGNHVGGLFGGSAVSWGSSATYVTQFHHNLMVGGSGVGGPVRSRVPQPLSGSCNAFWNNAGGVGDYAVSPTDLFLDPLFCDAAVLDFRLSESSPYAPTGTCGQVGAHGVGCGTVGVESISFGRIKSLYR
jgi:hypothetical protein